jgi:hypothetical protein
MARVTVDFSDALPSIATPNFDRSSTECRADSDGLHLVGLGVRPSQRRADQPRQKALRKCWLGW